MNTKLNYSPLKKKHLPFFIGVHKESEPKQQELIPALEQRKSEWENLTKQEMAQEPLAQVEVIPDLPEVDQGLLDEGVEVVDNNTLFVANGRKISLPMPLDSINQGLQKPLNRGWRWAAELARYILAKLGIKLKKNGGQFKLVEQS